MTIRKLRTALIVFLVGFLLGLSVFASSRLFIRSVISTDLQATAAALAQRLADREPVEISAGFSSVLRYSHFDAQGALVESEDLATGAPARVSAAEMSRTAQAAAGGQTIVDYAPLWPSLLGLAEPGIRGAAAPVMRDGEPAGAVYVETDQAEVLGSLTRAFSVAAMITISLAVLAVMAIVAATNRGDRGRSGRAFRPGALPRDPQTGLPDRQGFTAALDHAVTVAAAADHPLGLMIIDLDDFRTVNTVWGPAIADAVVKAVADRLTPFAKGASALARIGGDQFALLVEADADTHAMRQIADKIRGALTQPVTVADSVVAVGASIGAALYPVNADTAEMLFRAADTALSHAKHGGRNALVFFDTEMKKRMLRRTTLERDLRQALERDEFVVFYQPQMDLASGRVRGHEALVRWERPGEGILPPREFLPVAEETGFIRPLGEWVLRKACSDAASWLSAGTVAVNFSAAQFRFQALDQTIAKVLAETGLPPERLEIEVPESLFLSQGADVMETLTRIKALGVRVAMDDFGAGYSGLASLAHFPFDTIKVDRSFVGQLTEDAGVAAIVASIVGLGRSLSVDITAEGVETNEQVTLLKAAGCSIVQGFLFGVPQRGGTAAAAGPPAPADAVQTAAAGA